MCVECVCSGHWPHNREVVGLIPGLVTLVMLLFRARNFTCIALVYPAVKWGPGHDLFATWCISRHLFFVKANPPETRLVTHRMTVQTYKAGGLTSGQFYLYRCTHTQTYTTHTLHAHTMYSQHGKVLSCVQHVLTGATK